LKNQLRKLWFLIFIFSFLLSGCAYYNTYYNAQMYFEKGKKEFEKDEQKSTSTKKKSNTKNFDLAIEKSQRVLNKYPKSKWCDNSMYIIALSYYYKKNYSTAKKKFEEFFATYPNSKLKMELEVWYGRILWKMGDTELAIHQWQKSAEKIKDRKLLSEIYYATAELFKEEEKLDSAITYYTHVTEVRGGSDRHAISQFRIAELYLLKGEIEEAILNLERVASFTADPILKNKKQVLLVKIYRESGRFKKAKDLIQKRLASEKNKDIWGELELQLGLVYRDEGDTSAAYSRFKQIPINYKKTNESAGAYYYMGLMDMTINHDYKKAEKNFSSVPKEYSKSIFCFDAKQKTSQLKRFFNIKKELSTVSKIAEKILLKLISPENDTIHNDINEDIDPEELKKAFEEQEAEKEKIANIDTLSTFEKYYQKRYELAELYYFSFQFKDSAKIIFEDISSKQYFNPYIDKSLYALYYIYKKEKNIEKAENYKKLLEENSPDSPYLNYINNKKLVLPEQNILEKELYTNAENYIESNPDTAIILFQNIIDNFPISEISQQSILSIAWILEYRKFDLKNSLNWYKTLVDSFPDNKSFQYANQRYTFLKQISDKIALDSAKTADSLITALDSTTIISPQDTNSIAIDSSVIMIDSLNVQSDSTKIINPEETGTELPPISKQNTDSIKKEEKESSNTKKQSKNQKKVER